MWFDVRYAYRRRSHGVACARHADRGDCDRDLLARFGRGGFVEIAMRAGVPIIPIAVVGAEESMPILFKSRRLANLTGLPYFPVTANMLLMGPLGNIVIRGGNPLDPAFSSATRRPVGVDHLAFGIAPWEPDGVRAALASRGLRARADALAAVETRALRADAAVKAGVADGIRAVIGDVIVGPRCYIGPLASLRGDFGRLVLEEGANVQDTCVMHGFEDGETVIEVDGHIGHGAVLHGCRIGRNASGASSITST